MQERLARQCSKHHEGSKLTLDIGLFNKHIEWMAKGTDLFAEGASLLDLQNHDRPSLLQSWTVAHLIAHVNSNAKALVNLTVWARTGVVTPMYQSNEQRAKDIEEAAKQSLEFLIEDFQISSQEFLESISSLSREQLDNVVKSSRGRDIPVSDAVWIRVREVWIHAVDLGSGITFSRFPDVLLDALMTDVVSSFSGRENIPVLELKAADVSRTWKIGSAETATAVEGSQHAILAWLLGRSGGQDLTFGTTDGAPPVLPAWL